MLDSEQKQEMKLLGREAIEAYIFDGFICLKQDASFGEEPSTVMMLPSDIPQIVKWLQQLAERFES